MGELTYLLGIQVKQMEDTIFIFQSEYAKIFGMDDKWHKRTPAATHLKLSKDVKGVDVDQIMY
jgi:hypothetical protein